MGDATNALEDLDKATDLDRSFTQTWVKKASVHMELGMPLRMLFDRMAKLNMLAQDNPQSRLRTFLPQRRLTPMIRTCKAPLIM